MVFLYGVININIDKIIIGNIIRFFKVVDLENIYILYMYKVNKIKLLNVLEMVW